MTAVGRDETSCASGQHYVTIVADLHEGHVIFATPDNNAATVASFAEHLDSHGGDAAAVTEAVCDMSKAYISGIGTHLSNTDIAFDHFHVVKLVGEAVDKTRRAERHEEPWKRDLLKHHRYTVLRNVAAMTEEQALMATVIAMPALHLMTGKTCRMR